MPADFVHLVRHGEVHNPDRVLYGRLPEFRLSDLGQRMAAAAVTLLAGHSVTALYASPLQRTQESAAPWAEGFGLSIRTDERLIEPTNRFEGKRMNGRTLADPRHWPLLVNPRKPSWGEPFADIAARMLAVMHEARESVDAGEVVMVSHQLPIWMAHRALAGEPLHHDPRKRRCSLSSVTSFAWADGRFTETDYQEPAADLTAEATDLGAV
ncbi:MAG: histidine phosphatase family protein [Microcella sp.]|uniref:histidine phosphatase family protein n=1 Tax=Microcella sp. TaxID=1913979 RepID=UPI0024CCD16C|nr:histidine phosphatase family protein [Microcella sp.]UYN82817.1 MAG: histidine phosphatase family protein [Microcella sp.]